MSEKKELIAASCVASLLLMAACGPMESTPEGRFESRAKNEAELVLFLKADGTLIRAEGLRGGNFEQETVLSDKPKGLGKRVADIAIFEHDGGFNEITVDATPAGASAHTHSGPVTPPLNTHCHRYIRIDSQYVITHCP
jgi:hypothetical protein